MSLYIPFPSWLRPEIFPGLPFRWYGLMYLISFGLAYLLFNYQAKRKSPPIEKEEILNFFFWGIIGLLIGARILAALVYDPTGKYLAKPWLIFWPFQNGRFVGIQGMSYHGGLIGSIIALVIYCRVKKINTLEWGDMLVAGIPLGYTFGRLGNFINGELYGRVSTAPWAMVFPNAQHFRASEWWVKETAEKAGMEIPSQGFVNLPRHPSQLYEAFFEGIVLWLIIWFVFRKRKPYKGFLIGIYVIGYGIARFFLEYFRQPDEGIGYIISFSARNNPIYILASPWDFTTGQLLCLLMIVGGLISLLIFKYRADKQPKIETFDVESSRED